MSRCMPGLAAPIVALALLAGCNRLITPGTTRVIKDADTRAADGDYLHAINLYETALDGTAASAEIHYKLALLYDDKMHEPLNAVHHFKRYLTLAPSGSHAQEAKAFMKRGELALVTSLSGDAVVTRAEAVRLKNENLRLRKEMDEKVAQARAAAPAKEKSADRKGRPEKGASPAKKKSPPRSHVVQPGDTLFSLSRLYYNSPDKWKGILDANSNIIDDPGKLKVGQTLTIP